MSTVASSTSADLFEVHASANPVPADERAELLAAPRFGTVFTDHMARVSYSQADGWHSRRVEPYGPLQLDPATAVLHYGQEIFEGLKAYRHADGSVWTFRPQANAERFARSAYRLALPQLPEADFLGSIEALVRTDLAWVPTGEETSLYLRPFMYASEPFLGVRPSLEVEYLVIASPVGPYFSGGVKPVAIWVDQELHRAGAGGTGAAKCGGNYAASLLPQQLAYDQGCEQVCFLDASTNTYLEELGGMNVVVVHADGSVVTPPVSGSILEGVTRSSILQLLSDAGHEVDERPVALADLRAGLADGSITEVFACGTAAVITPIGRLKSTDFDLTVGDGGAGPVTMRTRAELTDIQYGRAADRHGWLHRLV
ncbi:MAG: branched-chain amino acid aminotransferase [Cellulomonas sp.]|uniref:branched-chain-amino-acid transaminase n=1 Tax=Cellulomonas gelida TaxID=1712 RepID=A0A4Y3KJA4_9CELL|nr:MULTISPECIES: branched-chain amino acid aminotransferase [Cellulomonas]KMM44996.1 branched-chain amino acid aminotransferase [Cellulomonas sp. A375-1]MCR6646776.1 branched-chain amino acid aminotransferase [Cellulomonas sp.]MCR6706427.1 branched-chain amino acid aminotransferase [Cellulomonas sp.]GEA83048.1 branched-chain-amino-acid aminotransferase [Cellulomonas gelida]GGL30595.1 branched-chain-amino-acid aminotransferase [Cellulomonas gelida]